MADEGTRVGEQRPGGRAARVRADVLGATSELLMEVGYDAMTVEDVATRAGVHKTTVYRRWPNKPDLVADAVAEQSREAVPIPDSGTIAGDLTILARNVVANIGSAGGSRRSRSIVAAAAASEELTATVHQLFAERLRLTAAVVERAIERGELPPGTDPNLVVETVVGPLWLRLLLTGEPLTDEFADDVVGLVTSGLGRR